MRYFDTLTNKEINQNNIVSIKSAGIVVYENGAWKFISSDRYTILSDNEVYVPKKKTDTDTNVTVDSIVLTGDDTLLTDDKIKLYTYFFGISSFASANKKYTENSAILTQDISIDPGTTISLKCDFFQPDKTSIEFYIVDGLTVAPIAPIGVTSIENEKVFFDTPTRFTPINNSKKLYENFSLLGYDVNNSNIDFKNKLYTMNYKIDELNQSYKTINKTIKIKAILRKYDGSIAAPQINSVCIARS